MPIIDDEENFSVSNTKLNLVQILNTVAFLLKQIRSESSWKIPAIISLVDLAQSQKGLAPLAHQHLSFADVSGLQIALDAKAAIDHNHPPEAWQDIPLASSWSNYGIGFATPQCRKLVGSLIEVRGTINKSSAAVPNEVVATLPAG